MATSVQQRVVQQGRRQDLKREKLCHIPSALGHFVNCDKATTLYLLSTVDTDLTVDSVDPLHSGVRHYIPFTHLLSYFQGHWGTVHVCLSLLASGGMH